MSECKLRVCVVSPLYHPSLGGLGRQAQLLTERLAESGLDVFVVARRMKGMPDAAFSPKVRVYRAWSLKPHLHTFEKVTFTNILISLTFSISCALLLFWKRRQYDIVHFHGASLPLFLNLPLLKLFRKRVIAKVAAAKIGTEAGSLKGRYFFLGDLIIGLLKMADAFIATSAEIEEGLANDGFGRERIKRIPNFIDFVHFSPAASEEKAGMKEKFGFKGKRIVVFSGRFIGRKGIPVLLDAWKKVIIHISDAQLILLGEGPLLDDMKKLAAEQGINKSVEFKGHLPFIADYLRAADIFVLPSLQEGMPNALLEAMGCGLPAVATRIGGVVDIIRDGENGMLVEPGNAEAMAQGVIKLLRDEEFAAVLGLKAFYTIRDSYSIESAVSKYIVLYSDLQG